MSTRFEEGSDEAVQLLNETIEENFPVLEGAAIKLLFDTKKRKSGGKYVLGRLQKSNDLTKHLSSDNTTPQGVDYILYVDKNLWDQIPVQDRKRLIFHELCHTDVDFEKSEPYRVRGHSIEGFHEELSFNKDDPEWHQRIANIAESLYEKD